ncbi:pyruvate kinase [Sulfurimonas xiamenensis]|uniref:Pyruvate kinase n=1 Tax=Sulfurimonas xiamenensis TaxID=2590021 RepID=A0AAJ4DMP1_9BACT|nr:pyruvate kinase [Sulfurimonas xiamenensis]QFR43359.1 pyruvate kinase [Sulfurimonas xiamenensis]
MNTAQTKYKNGLNQAFLSELLENLLELKEKLNYGIDPQIKNVSLLNMKQYLNLRKYDYSLLQDNLTRVGLSSFGRSQAHIEASVIVALRMLSLALDRELELGDAYMSYEDSHAIMDKNATLFSNSDDKTKIMITVDSNYEEDKDYFSNLSREGVHLFRINTAHDNPKAWKDMAKSIKNAQSEDKELKVYVDLAGPKIRTSLREADRDKKIKVFYNEYVLIQSSLSQAFHDKKNRYSAIIGCTLEKLGSITSVGDHVFIDDGKIQMVIEEIEGEDIVCRVLTNSKKGSKIKDEKGINLPNSDISLAAISEHDKEILPFICEYADIIGISFVQGADDVRMLIEELERLGKKDKIGIVAKIETKKGVQNLPSILEALIEYERAAIMIARGDLAIEIGFENLAYIQEEILDLCTAAHIPVILATQVLESKMKTNLPSRAEISDVSFAHKAECVMLNKGEYALETIKILRTILLQMDMVFRKNKLLYNHSFEWK